MTPFAIQPWATKSPMRSIVAAVGAGLLAFALQAVVLDKLFAEPLATLSQPASTHRAQRRGFTECIQVNTSNLVKSC